MKFFTAVVVLFAALCSLCRAQNASSAMDIAAQMPDCALRCVLTTFPKSTCSLTNATCICTNTDLSNEIETCVLAGCTIKNALRAQRVQKTICNAPIRNQSLRIRLFSWIFTAIAIIAVAMRLTSRLPQLGGLMSWDDYSIIVAIMSSLPCAIIIELITPAGVGQDIWMLEFDGITKVLLGFYVIEFLYISAMTFLKVAILLLLLRIFPQRRFRMACWTVIIILLALSFAAIIATVFQCTPVQYAWQRWDGEHKGKCINYNALVYFGAAANLVLDMVCFVMPIRPVMKLNLNWRKKVSVTVIFSIGLFSTLCSILRLNSLVQYGHSRNPTWDYGEAAIWSAIESQTGIICACMPGMTALVRRVFPSLLGTTNHNSIPSRSIENIDDRRRIPVQPTSKLSSYTFHDNRSDTVELATHPVNADNDSLRNDKSEHPNNTSWLSPPSS